MNKRVAFVDLRPQYNLLQEEVSKAIKRVFRKSTFISGEEVELFEEEFAKYLGAKHCITLNSGTDALILGIRALGFSPGDEIIVPANTFIATALGVSMNGLKPVFVDIDLEDNGISLDDLKRKINKRTKAIIPVHLYGQPDKLDEIKDVVSKSGNRVSIIEDACQAHGAKYKGIKVGNFGVFSAFSFYPGKNLGAYGDGGAVVTNDDDFAQKVRLLREYGQSKKYHHDTIGINSRLDTIQAAILRVKLRHLDEWNSSRQVLAAEYDRLLKGVESFIEIPKTFDDRKSIYHLYVIRSDRREFLRKHLEARGIISLIHYPIPLHLQKAYAYLGWKEGDLPGAEKTAGQTLSLPMYPELSEKQMQSVAEAVKEFFNGL